MSILKKPYEVSVWLDVWDNSTNSFTEEQVAIIGSDTMTSQYRVLEPKFKRNVNGSNELTFKMHRRYKDSMTGQEVVNPFIDLVVNETKLKLKYNGKWYDFLVKNIQQDSNNTTFTFTATDLHITELSKNGYGLVMDTTLMNNSGTVKELAEKVLEESGWTLNPESESPKQYLEEQLVSMLMPPAGVEVWVPYSSLKEQPEYFQYFTSLTAQKDGVYEGDQDYVIVNDENPYITDAAAIRFGFYYPTGWTFNGITSKRGNRLVYTHLSKFNSTLNKVVYFYNNKTIAGYTETEYLTPNLIDNYVTNNTFKSTSGWTGAYVGGPANKGAEYNAVITATALSPSGSELLEDMKSGSYNAEDTYTPCLKIKMPQNNSLVVNSGFYDNRTKIKNVAAGEKYVLFFKENTGKRFVVQIGERKYLTASGQYDTAFESLLNFSYDDVKTYHSSDSSTKEYEGYKYIVATVNSDYNKSQKEFQKKKYQIFLSGSEGEYTFFDFQVFPFIPTKDDVNVPMLPVNVPAEASAVTKYYYYRVADYHNPVTLEPKPNAEGYVAAATEYKYVKVSDTPAKDYRPDYTTDKIRSVDIKQSNYFNAIQTLCEKFECWADFSISHTADGRILGKSVTIKEYIGQDNHAGFRYGVNLKNTKRTLDSKAVVTKLIVPDNTNEFAPNGFCSITRAGANPNGENYIYNFQYYINMGLLNQDTLDAYLYGENGYYTSLLALNSDLNELIDSYTSISNSLMKATADLQVAENGRIASEEKYRDAADSFASIAGYNFQDIVNIDDDSLSPEQIAQEIARRQKQIEDDETLAGYLTEVAEYYAAWKKYSQEEIAAKSEYDGYKADSEALYASITQKNEEKKALNLAFFQKFYRFIQEGTWKGDEYTDNEKYYIDAFSTSNNSCLPKVSYTFSVLDLSAVPGYQALSFGLADKTWVEDVEFFGYAEDGTTPYREEVVITEVVYNLDEPDKNTIKVQNYKDQFADLFQKQTATVQQVQFAKGAWSKAANFTEAEASTQAAFLQNAMANAELVLQNAGEQSVVWDKNGITVTDVDTPSQQLRLVGGAIMMRDEDEDGLGWKVGITSKGINAKLLTAGQINTGLIQVMRGDEPYFRWDANGITAYYFETDPNKKTAYNYGLNTRRGVRYDRFGIYGYRNPVDDNGAPIDGATWHPATVDEIIKHSQFALTWDGLYLNLGHATYDKYYRYEDGVFKPEIFDKPIWHAGTTVIGKTSEYLFNKWVEDRDSDLYGLPYYDKNDKNAKAFAKIFAIGGADGNEELVIYDDGTLVANKIKLTGSVEWTKNTSPAKTVYGKIALKTPPANNTPYVKFPDKDGAGTEQDPYVWHKIVDINDTVYAHTDNGGATWEGPFLITGRSIEYTEVQYCMADRGMEPKNIPDANWRLFFPTELVDGKCVFTRMRDVYNNGESTEWRYSVGYIGTSNYRISLDNDYSSIAVENKEASDDTDIDTLVDKNWRATLNAEVYYGDEPDKGKWVFSVVPSRDFDGLKGSVSGKVITIMPQTNGKLAGEEHVVGIKAYNVERDLTLFGSFTAAKLHAGDDAIGYKVIGYPTTIVRHVNTDNSFTPDDFVLSAHKQVGAYDFTECAGFWKYSINDEEVERYIGDDAQTPTSTIEVELESIFKFINSKDLKKLTIYFYLNADDTIPADKEVIAIAEDGRNGVSITGVDELYYASATEDEKIPPVQLFNPDGSENTESVWKYNISGEKGTGYGPDLPYLWNVERIRLSDSGNDADFTDPQMIAYYGSDGAQGRGLKNIVSYYFINQDSLTPPAVQPEISEADKAQIVLPEGWMDKEEDFELHAGDCLWEKNFFEFDQRDLDGHIYVAQIPSLVRAIPKDVYRIALTNDSGVVVTDTDGDGGMFGENTKTQVIVYKGDEDDSANWTVSGSSADLNFSYTKATKTFEVKSFNKADQTDPDNGYLEITAQKAGSAPLKTTFKVSKLKQGKPGEDAVAYWLTCSTATIPVTDQGVYGVQTITFSGKQQTGAGAVTEYTPYQFEIYVNGVLEQTFKEVSSVTCKLGEGGYNVTNSLSCLMYYNETIVIDEQTAEVVRDGASLARLEVTNWYLATDQAAGVTKSTNGWTQDLTYAQTTEKNKYLWNYETIISYRANGSEISSTESAPSIIGVHGQNGKPGVGIASIKDYYGVSNARDVYPVVWYNAQEQSSAEMPEPSPETPYLWTYEKFVYSDGSMEETNKRIISELSISIESITDYYFATAKQSEKPDKPIFDEEGKITNGWTTLNKCGHGEEKPFLWNTEVIGYNYGKDTQFSEVTLVSRTARSIKSITEYYCITNTAAQPTAITLIDNNNEISIPTSENWRWVAPTEAEPLPSLEQGQWLWNQEIIEYTTKDDEAEGKYSITSVQLMGYIGTSPYLINLTSDFATIPYTYDNVITEAVFGDIDFSYQVFNGAKELNLGTDFVFKGYFDENAPENKDKDKTSLLDGEEDKLQVIVVIRNATAQKPEEGTDKDIDIYFDPDVYTAEWARGTIAVELYEDSVLMATATYELAKQSGGVDGSYEYLVTSSPIIKKLTSASGVISYEPNQITFTLLKRIGDKEPKASTETRWANTYIDGKLTAEKQSFTGELTVSGEVTTEIKVEVFTDADCSNLLDRETIPVIADGVDAYNSTVLTVYQRASSKPSKPGNASYDFNASSQMDGLDWETDDSPWALTPQEDVGDGTTRYKSMVSIRNREHLHAIAADDWSDPIIDDLPDTYEEVITLYTEVKLEGDQKPEDKIPSKPTGLTYNLKTREFTDKLPTGWSREVPASKSGYARYFCTAFLTSPVWEVVVDEELSNVGIYLDDGMQTADVVLYQRPVVLPVEINSFSAPGAPTGTYSYNFATKVLTGSGENNGWETTEPADNGYPLWVVKTRVTSYTETGTASGWSDPIMELSTAINTAEITLYQLADAAPTLPTGDLIYTFASKSFDKSLGSWSTSVPSRDTNEKKRMACYITSAIAASNYPFDIIEATEWTTPVVDTENAANEYLEVTPKRVVGRYEEGILKYTPENISVDAYRVVGSADPLKITHLRYFKFSFDDVEQSLNNNNPNVTISGDVRVITVRAFSDAACTDETANETVVVVNDSVSISNFEKRYLTTDKDTGITKNNALKEDYESATAPLVWTKTPEPVSSVQPYTWVYDRINYTDGSFQITDPIRLTNESNYNLTLDNDIDVIAISNQSGLPIGWKQGEIITTVTLSRWSGSLSKDVAEEISTVECVAPTNNWKIDTHYTFEKNADNKYVLTIKELPSAFANGQFTFHWKGETTYSSKQFSLSTVTSLFDYDFIFDQTVFNSSHGSGTYDIKVQKKGGGDTVVNLTPANGEVDIYLKKDDGDVKLTSWKGISYNRWEKEPRIYELRDAAKDTILWDREVVEFVNDGESEVIETNVSQVVAAYENDKLVYTPSQITAVVYRIVGGNRENISTERDIRIVIDNGVTTHSGANITLGGDVDSITVEAYPKGTQDFSEKNRTSYKTIPVTGKTNSIIDDAHLYLLSDEREGVEFTEANKNSWSATKFTVTPRYPYLWAVDRFKYASGNWITSTPYIEEYLPECSLALNNESDVVSRLTTGQYLIDKPIEVKLQRKIGGKEYSSFGTVTVLPASIDGFVYSFAGNTMQITSIDPAKVFSKQDFVFTWTWTDPEDNTVIQLAQKTFSLSVVVSEVDYDLMVPKTSINLSSEEDITNALWVSKLDKDGRHEITGADDREGLEIWANGTKIDNWTQTYSYAKNSDTIVYTLKRGDVTWDEQSVDFVFDSEKDWIVTSTEQITGEYKDGKLIYTPTSFEVSVMHQKGENPAYPVTDARTIKLYIDGVESTAEDVNAVLTASGEIKRIDIEVYKDIKATYTASKIIPVSTEPPKLASQKRYYRVADSVEDVTPDTNKIDDPKEKAYWTAEDADGVVRIPTESNPTIWHYDKSVMSDGSVVRTKPTAEYWSSPYIVDLSNDSATIGASSEGVVNNELLETISTTSVTAWHGDVNITDQCKFDWKITGGVAAQSGTGATSGTLKKWMNYFTSMSNDTATMEVTITRDSTLIGAKTFTISKIRQTSLCYIESTNGTMFEETDTSSTTTLTAKIFSGGIEVDPQGEKLTYKWYKDTSSEVVHTGKVWQDVEVTKLRNVSLHFIAE